MNGRPNLMIEVLRAEAEWQRAGAYSVRIEGMNRAFHISLREEFDEKLSHILETKQWIIDGNYQRTLPIRFEKCTGVFLFDLPVEQCLQGAAARIGKAREDLPWVETELDREFKQYILDFQKDQIPKIYELIEKYKGSREVTIFRSREEADDWIENGILTEHI